MLRIECHVHYLNILTVLSNLEPIFRGCCHSHNPFIINRLSKKVVYRDIYSFAGLPIGSAPGSLCEQVCGFAHLRGALAVLLEELVEPLHSLEERSLFCELDVLLADVGADGKAVLDTRVENHLVGDAVHLLEQLLGLVALVFGEDVVGLCGGNWLVNVTPDVSESVERTSSGNREWAGHALDLVLVDERRVCGVTNINALALSQEARDVLSTKAVSNRADLLRALLLHVRQSLLDDRVNGVRQVALAFGAALLQPVHDVEALGRVELHGVALEEVGHDDVVAVGGELVGDELGVDELMADNVGEDDDGGGSVLGLWEGDVGRDLSVG
jgi:hypothetical protein